jgi:hypothetical protein
MPLSQLDPYWQTRDEATVRLYHGDALEVLERLPSQSVHCAVTSPPYWGLRKYLTDDNRELGLESHPDLYVSRLVEVFRELRRVLRDDSTFWLDIGDTFGPKGDWKRPGMVGIPHRLAFALQDDGWILAMEHIWCLSGGTWLYVRSQKGDMPMMVRGLARLDPATVQLWNGERWTQLLGMNCSKREGEEIEIVLRSGERISCTPNHKFPTDKGLLEARQLRLGDCLQSCRLPEPERPRDSRHINLDAAWFAGLYLAEGCGAAKDKICIAGHSRETERWERVQKVVKGYGGFCTLTVNGNNQTIRVFGKVICAVVRELITGANAKTKGIATVVWRYSNAFIKELMLGYLGGDGHDDILNNRWTLGFTRNYNLERDLRTACARLGWALILRPTFADYDGRKFPSFHGEIREVRSGHWNEKDRAEIVEIRKARCREVYDLGVADEPHTFSLASGILTHNSKPSPMTESVTNRCTKSHEYVFIFVKKAGYFFDQFAIREKSRTPPGVSWESRKAAGAIGGCLQRGARQQQDLRGSGASHDLGNGETRNKRSVWEVSHGGYKGAHFATFSPSLILPCIKAGTSEKGCCTECGSPWKRVVERVRQATRPGENSKITNVNGDRLNGEVTGNRDPERHVTSLRHLGWYPSCKCYGLPSIPFTPSADDPAYEEWVRQARELCRQAEEEHSDSVEPCVVLDPFIGSGTTAVVCVGLGRYSMGIDLSEEYLKKNAIPRIEGELLGRPALATLVPR